YPLYLVHSSWGRWVIESVHPYLSRAATLAVAAAVCVLLAGVVHRAVERPLGPRLRHALDRDLRRDAREPDRRPAAPHDEAVPARQSPCRTAWLCSVSRAPNSSVTTGCCATTSRSRATASPFASSSAR